MSVNSIFYSDPGRLDRAIKSSWLPLSSTIWCSCLLPILLSANGLWAIEPDDILFHRIGNVSLRPSFEIIETYNDNIFYRTDTPIFFGGERIPTAKKEGDLITSATGGATVVLGNPSKNWLSIDYSYTHRFFLNHSDQNAGRHHFGFGGTLNRGKVSLAPSFNFDNDFSPLSGATRATSPDDSTLVERSILGGTIVAMVKFTPKTFTTTTGQYSLTDFGSNTPILDSDNISFQQGLGFHIRPKVSLSAYGIIGRRTTSVNTRFLVNNPGFAESLIPSRQPYVGGGFSAKGKFTNRITGEVSFGIQRLSYSEVSASFITPVVEFSLEYWMGRDIVSDISYIRSTFVDLQSENSSGVSDSVRIAVSKPFGRRKNWRVTASGSLSFQNWEIGTGPSSDRSEDFFTGTFSIQHKIQEWLSSSLSYSSQMFSSNRSLHRIQQPGRFGIVDYDVNTVRLSIKVGY
ncbi:MAG: hypothetical protein M2R45_04737 [Verrucomicrobia subdivision 3 bacterium]|nr:hypothetical protein [Limisphaerales bacterium]MCS1415757.1 hypothetical protein [Limisphaerales bacterium]